MIKSVTAEKRNTSVYTSVSCPECGQNKTWVYIDENNLSLYECSHCETQFRLKITAITENKRNGNESVADAMINVTCDGMNDMEKSVFSRKLAEHLREKSNAPIETVRFCKEWISDN